MKDADVQLLVWLGHANGIAPLEGVKRFQKHCGLTPDGVVGPKTAAKLDWYHSVRITARGYFFPRLAPIRVTQYWFAEEKSAPASDPLVPLYGVNGVLAKCRASFFSSAALNGSGVLLDGRMINVAGIYVHVGGPANGLDALRNSYNRYVDVQKAKGKKPKPPRYFGIDGPPVSALDERISYVSTVQTFKFRTDIMPASPYGIGKKNVPFVPLKTLATDTGYSGWKNPDPRYKGNGGLIPPGSRVFFLERNEWYTANDTGGGIYGAHVDEFMGVASLAKTYPVFPRAHMFVDVGDFSERFPVGYELGLFDK